MMLSGFWVAGVRSSNSLGLGVDWGIASGQVRVDAAEGGLHAGQHRASEGEQGKCHMLAWLFGSKA